MLEDRGMCTRASLADDLGRLGIQPGMVLLVHASLNALGWVCGGEVALIEALMDALTPQGTLVMPAHSGEYSDPSHWENPPVPQAWWPAIRQHMPAFRPDVTPTRSLGRTAECFRSWPQVVRSQHPQNSFSAWGRWAPQITADHELAYSLGEGSPLGRLYDLEGHVLLAGAGYDSATIFHLAEYRSAAAPPIQQGGPILEDDLRIWKTYPDLDINADDFAALGAALEDQFPVKTGQLGSGVGRVFPVRPAVDFAATWLAIHRSVPGQQTVSDR
jgi:aminoglycoside 3-N-acetyltransferase